MIDVAQRAFFGRNGYLHLPGWIEPEMGNAFAAWTAEIEAWPDTPGRWMRYYEKSAGDAGRMPARIENFLPYHGGIDGFFSGKRLNQHFESILGEPVVVFKDKINLKGPGGAGFTAHQDGPAYVGFGVDFFVTAMVPIDPFTPENGCLEMAREAVIRDDLPQNPDGTIRDDIAATFDWIPVLAHPGDLIVFDSRVPHRSGPNRSSGRRRSFYVTYNRLSAGDRRAAYYQRKRELFPPECERQPGVDYARLGAQFNLANPFE